MTAAILAMALSAAAAAGAPPDLDAPIDARPTLGSELRRGWDAADRCPAELFSLDRALCIDGVISAEKGLNGHAEPFVLGAEFRAWFEADRAMQADQQLAANQVSQADLPQARRACASAALVARDLQKKLGLTDAQLFTVAVVRDPAGLAARWAWWQAQPLATIAYPEATP